MHCERYLLVYMSNYKGYFLKSLGLREDSLPGGKGDEKQPDEVNKTQLQMGIKVEMEHTKDAALAKEIAMDHLAEDPQYYAHLKDAGMADELPEGIHGEMAPKRPMMSKLFSPTAIMPTPVIAVGIRGTKTGLLPAGGIVDDPEKARLGGLELVKNLKPNSQGAIANTPSSKDIQADGGHFTPDNKEITKGKSPTTNVKGDDSIHPMQVQQLGNKPFEDDGTTRDGEHTPSAAGGDGDANNGDKRCKDAKSSSQTASDDQDFDSDEKNSEEEKVKGPWGIEMDGEEEGEDISMDIKESKKDEFSVTHDDFFKWDDLVELFNRSKFQTPHGKVDMYFLMGTEGLRLSDADKQTPKFFDFIMRHSDEAVRAARQQGESVQLPDYNTLQQQWKKSKIEHSNYYKQQKNQPRPCKVCGTQFTPKKGEGICPKCVTKTSNDKDSMEDTAASDPESPKFDWKRFGGPGARPADYKENTMKRRFQELANIPNEKSSRNENLQWDMSNRDPGDGDDWQDPPDMAAKQARLDLGRKQYKGPDDWEEDERSQLGVDEAGALSELKQIVQRLKARGKTSQLMEKAEQLLAKRFQK